MLLLTSLPIYAGTMGDSVNEHPWYASIGTGYSWTLLPGINNPNPNVWDDSVQGYNSSLGNRGFYTFEIGKEVHKFIDISLLYLNHETFNYQMYQSGISNTEGFTGDRRNRYFNLNNRALLVSGFVHPEASWHPTAGMKLKPFIGAGIGYALNQIENFYTVGTVNVNGTAFGSTSSIGNQVSTNSFAWQASAGINIMPLTHFSLDVGYRYYDGGNFNTSNSVYSDASGFVSATPWKGNISANQLFIDFKYTL